MNDALIRKSVGPILGIDHVAIAVDDLEASIAWYCSTLGFSLTERIEASGSYSGMLSATLKSGDTIVVLIQGTTPESQVSKFLAAFGSGIHHIAFAVSNLEEALTQVTEAGGIADTPIIADDGIRQVFLQRDVATGVRVELVERQGVSFSQDNVANLFKAIEKKGVY